GLRDAAHGRADSRRAWLPAGRARHPQLPGASLLPKARLRDFWRCRKLSARTQKILFAKTIAAAGSVKNKTLHMIGNAHIDPVWLWQWQEGFHEVKASWRSALDRIKEYPDFIFTASSAAYYEWVEHN